MASARYTRNIKPEDLQPDKPAEPMTPKQKRENFWFYYKWYVLGGILIVVLLGFFIHDMSKRQLPDLEVSIVTSKIMPTSLLVTISEELQRNANLSDINGDGKVVVQVNQYNISTDGSDESLDYTAQMAGSVKLSADIQEGISPIFITDNLEGLSQLTGAFLPEEGSVAVSWEDAKGLSDLNLVIEDDLLDAPIDVNEIMKDFEVVRRGYMGTEKESTLETAKEGDKLYESLTGVPARW